jgi:hypothetical protein
MTQLLRQFSKRTGLTNMLAGAALALAACATAPAYSPTAPTFDPPPSYTLAAGVIAVVIGPNVEDPKPGVAIRLATTPKAVVADWARSRLVADLGSTGRAELLVEEASATETALETRGGVTGVFTRDPKLDFKVAFAVTLNLFDGAGRPAGSARATSSASATFAEGQDEDQRRRIWERLLKQAAERMDAEMQAQLQSGLDGRARLN